MNLSSSFYNLTGNKSKKEECMSSKKHHVSELSPQEFQKTFPIILKDVQQVYADWYEEEKTSILGVLDPQDIVRM